MSRQFEATNAANRHAVRIVGIVAAMSITFALFESVVGLAGTAPQQTEAQAQVDSSQVAQAASHAVTQ